MNLPIILHAIAQREFDDAVDWYEKRSPGQGTKFINRVLDLLQRIQDNPRLYAEVENGIREARVPKYPYCVYFRMQTDRISVISVFHTSRDPSIWRERE